jgi:hypothetical protein
MAAYSGSAISNYLYGIQVWHILHRTEIEKLEMDTILKAAEKILKAKKETPLHPQFHISHM